MKLLQTIKRAVNEAVQAPIVIKFHTYDSAVFKNSKPNRASKFMPDWWKTLPIPPQKPTVETFNQNNMRGCLGFLSMYQNGVVIPMWSDITIRHFGDGGYQYVFADRISAATDHKGSEMNHYWDAHAQNIKLGAPWQMTCDEDIQFVLFDPVFGRDNPFEYAVAPGVSNFGAMHEPNVNMFLPVTGVTTDIFIPAGRPMVHLIPLSTRPIKVEHYLISKDAFDTLARDVAPVRFFFSARKTATSKE